MANANIKPENKEATAFRMGSQEKHSQNFKTKLIKAAGGYGGFIRKYKRDPFNCTEDQAKKFVGRNEKCICGSGKKVKRCCLSS